MEKKLQSNDKMICGEFANKTFFIRPGFPSNGLLQRISELEDTVPKPIE